MYLSRIQLRLNHLKPEMLQKWQEVTPYASHQWLWQLFPEQQKRPFLFRQEPEAGFYVLSQTSPLHGHNLFSVETKAFNPRLEEGLELDFQLRANPVITRKKQRYDVMMDAKFQAKANGVARHQWWELQIQAAYCWLSGQGLQHGFSLVLPAVDDFAHWAGSDENASAAAACVSGYQQHRFQRREDEQPVRYSSVDYAGRLKITDVARFQHALFNGIGKSKALGCGMLMVKR